MGRGNPNLHKYGIEKPKPKKVNSNIGRPVTRFKTICGRLGIDYKVKMTKQEKYSIAESMIEMSANELEALSQDKRIPIFVSSYATALLNELKIGGTRTLELLLDRFFGKPTQEVVTIKKNVKPSEENLKDFSTEELSKYLQERSVNN